jgi:hypothetical protein
MFAWLKKHFWSGIPPEVMQARQLIKAIDQGGLPLNPIKVNHIARSLGLEVDVKAPMQETIERIRQALIDRALVKNMGIYS